MLRPYLPDSVFRCGLVLPGRIGLIQTALKEKSVNIGFLWRRRIRKWSPVLFILFLIYAVGLRAQVGTDTVRVSVPVEKSPRGAILRSALIPGWGQWYNEQKLKALVVFSGEMALLGTAVYYNQLAVKSTMDYEREFYEYNRGRFLWWLLGVHLINILDAYVDAHLWNFDTGPDLSFRGSMREGKEILIAFSWRF